MINNSDGLLLFGFMTIFCWIPLFFLVIMGVMSYLALFGIIYFLYEIWMDYPVAFTVGILAILLKS